MPCGAAAQKVFTNAGVTVKPVTLEPDVKSVLSKVQLGEVDAGVVYVTDVLAAGDKVVGVEIPADVNASTSYPIAALTRSSQRRDRRRVRRLRALARGRDRADRGRLPAAVTAPPVDRVPRRPPSSSTLSRRERERRATGGGAGRSAPAALLVPAVVAIGFLVIPLAGLLLRAPWGDAWSILHGSQAAEALKLSLWTSTVATAISLVVGVPLAWLLARTEFPGLRLVRALVTLPLVLPPVVGGVALLLAFGRNGFLGQYLDQWFGITIPFTPAAVVMAETFVAMPFLVVTVEGALRSADRGFEEAAATLGAPRMVVFRRVTLPLVAPSLVAGAVLCWARALGEFGATITFAGSFPGRTQTMPIAVYYALETDPDAAILLSLVLLLVSVVVLVALRDRWLRGGGGRMSAMTSPDRATRRRAPRGWSSTSG